MFNTIIDKVVAEKKKLREQNLEGSEEFADLELMEAHLTALKLRTLKERKEAKNEKAAKDADSQKGKKNPVEFTQVKRNFAGR